MSPMPSTADRPAAGRVRVAATLRSLVALVVLAMTVLATAGHAGAGATRSTGASAGAGGATGTAAAAPGQQDAAHPLHLHDQTPFVAPEDTLVLGLDVAALPEDATLTFELRGLITATGGSGRAGIDEALSGRLSGNVLARLRDVPLANLPRRDADPSVAEARLPVVPGPDVPLVGFRIGDAGVYPLTVIAHDPGGAELDQLTTFLIRLPDKARADQPPLTVATLLPVGGPLATRPDGTVAVDDATRDAVRRLVDTLTTEPGIPLTVAPVPETLDALAGRPATDAGSAGSGEGADDVLRRLAAASRGGEVVGQTYVPLDVSAWAASGMTVELAAQRAAGLDATVSRLPGAPTPDRRTWLASADTTADGFAALRAQGIEQVVLPEDMLVPLDPKVVKGTLAEPFDVEAGTGGTLRAVQADLRLRNRLVTTDDPARNAQLLLADLAALWFEQPTVARGAVVVVPTDNQRALAALTPFLAALRTAPPGGTGIFDAGTLDDLFALQPAMAGRPPTPLVRPYVPQTPQGHRASMGTFPQGLARARHALDGYRSMVGQTAPDRLAPLEHLLTVSGAAALTPTEQQAYLDAVTAEVDRQASGVAVAPDAEGITIAATEAQIPVVLENRLDHPVQVVVAFESEKLEFVGGPAQAATLQPGTNKLTVPVRARASGELRVDAKVSSPDATLTLATSRFSVRSTAISGWGLALSIGAGLFLAVWWARHWRDGRRARKLVDAPDGADDEDPAGAAPGEPAPALGGSGEADLPVAGTTTEVPTDDADEASPAPPADGGAPAPAASGATPTCRP